MIKIIGSTFAKNSQWYIDEKNLLEIIARQINLKFPKQKNLLISLTWFGPQFENSDFYQIQYQKNFDNVFFLSSVDAPMITYNQINDIIKVLSVSNSYLLGNFETQYQFNFISTLLPKYFQLYDVKDLELTDAKYLYMNLNRKPRQHRAEFVDKLKKENLVNFGLVSLGKNEIAYSKKSTNDECLLVDQDPDYDIQGNWGMDDSFGIVHDIHTLGNLQFWSSHFLNIVGETEFNPWDPMFITEKTWKPILGLRPFVINGQTKIYQYLRDNGFKTFESYFNNIELENIPEYQVHDSIIEVIKFLTTLNKSQLHELYEKMKPDLIFNRNRFFEFASEQKYLIENLFV